MVTMPQNTISSAAVIGTGMMGPGIALTLSSGGLRATIVSLIQAPASKIARTINEPGA